MLLILMLTGVLHPVLFNPFLLMPQLMLLIFSDHLITLYTRAETKVAGAHIKVGSDGEKNFSRSSRNERLSS